MNNINIRKKNNDGTYDDGEFLFTNVDLYNGCYINRILELSPISNRQENNVKISIRSVIGDREYNFKPEEDGSYYLVDINNPGIKFYFTDKNQIKYLPDKNGIISLVNVLTIPMDIIIHMIAEKYTITELDKNIIIDDIDLVVWSSDNESK